MTSVRDLAAIADALSIKPGETVLEIGPGTGALTGPLLERGAHVIAVEKDAALARELEKKFADAPLRVLVKDILQLDLRDLKSPSVLKVAGNIPYYITSPIIEWLISQRKCVSQTVLTVQWEVARRLAAEPGGKDWGSLSIFLRYYANVEFLRKIDKSCFFPVPKVHSGVIRLTFLGRPRFTLTDESLFFSLVRRAFQKRRKTLLNALEAPESQEPTKETLRQAFSQLDIDPRRRPETLSLDEWAALSEALGSPSQK